MTTKIPASMADSDVGRIIQVVNTQSGAVATGTGVIPWDDTIPQIGEGNEFMTRAITPTSASNLLRIDVVITLNSGTSVNAMIAALFQDATANALAAMHQLPPSGTTQPCVIKFTHYMTAGTTSSTTFRVRAGASSAATTTFNGIGGARYLGGVMASSITITEIKA